MKELSAKQQSILNFIREFWSDRGYPPTIRDIQNACQLSSTSVVNYNLNILERKGLIRRHHEVSRGIELPGRPSGQRQIPVIGQIAAGEPVPVPTSDTWNISTLTGTIDVPLELVKGKEEVYALKVKGNSMVDALVNDGDIVLVQHQNAVDNGDMAVIWLKEEKEATLKKFYAESDRIRLQPANSQMRPIYADPANVEVQGKVIAVIRKLG